MTFIIDNLSINCIVFRRFFVHQLIGSLKRWWHKQTTSTMTTGTKLGHYLAWCFRPGELKWECEEIMWKRDLVMSEHKYVIIFCYTCLYTYIYIHISIYIYLYTYVYIHMSIYIYLYTHVYIHMSIYICLYTYIYIHISRHMYIDICI
jgi:hypothetical protein